MKKTVSLFLVTALLTSFGIHAAVAETNYRPQEIFVEQGALNGDGTYRLPYGSFEEARNHIRALKEINSYPQGGIIVNFREGIYPITQTISLNETDSGTKTAPVIYRAFQNEKVEFVGGKYFDVNNEQAVSDEYALTMLNESIIENVRQIPIADLGLTAADFGEIDLRGSGATFLFNMGYTNNTPNAELYYGEESMAIARWPNLNYEDYKQSYVVTGDIVEEGTDAYVTNIDEAVGMSFKADIPVEKLNKWNEQKGKEDIWLHGFWYYDWSDSTAKLSEINLQNQTLSTLHPSAYKVRKGQRFFVFNALSELDAPGEWYLDKETENLYVYPKGNDKIFISLYKGTLLYALGLSNVIIDGINFKGTRGTAVSVRNCENVEFNNLKVSCCNENGVVIANSNNSCLKSSEIFSIGGYAASVSGGDFTTLAKGNSYIDNCIIHDYAQRDMTNTPGVHLGGVGNTISHCEIYNAPHLAIKLSGNDNIIEYNNIHDVLKDADDAAAIYSFRGATKRGNEIRHNYIHDLISHSTANSSTGVGIYGVYDDGGMCGTTIKSNIFENITKSGGAVMLGHRDTTVKSNIVIDCYSVARVTGSELFRLVNGEEYDASLQGLTGDYYKNEPYTKYQHLSNMLEDEPLIKKYNVIEKNIDYRPKKFWGYSKDIVYTHFPQNDILATIAITAQSLFPDATEEELEVIINGLKENEEDNTYIGREYINRRNSFSSSIRTNSDPGLADVLNKDYSVPKNSAIYSTFPDFEAPDFNNIGLREKPSFGVRSVSVKKSSGDKILKLSEETDKVDITVSFLNDNKEKDVYLFAALYNSKGAVEKIRFAKGKITSDNKELSVRNFEGCDKEDLYLKVFIWNADGSITPIDMSYIY